MIEVPILKEIRSYETYIVGHLTTRQLICGVVAAAGAYGSYFLQKNGFGLTEPIGGLIALAAAPGALFMFKPYGIPMEKFLKSAFVDNYLAPRVRPYVLENPLNQAMNALKSDMELEESEMEIDDENWDDEKEQTKKKPKKKEKVKKKSNKKLPPELQPIK